MSLLRPSLLRRLTLSVLLPLVLLFSQQGALLHELSHFHRLPDSAVAEPQASSVDQEVCLDCLAFAQIAGLAQFDVPTMPSAEAQGHHYESEVARDVADAESPALRSRGPPRAA